MAMSPITQRRAADDTQSPLDHARGLAELAFGSFTRTAGAAGNRHLALMPAETLELDLSDPAQRCLGDYELQEMLGEGGMGVVYRALQLSLDREVAVKLLSAGPWASREFVARFEREAQNAARMQHPNIVTIYEVGQVEGLQFFSMRLVRGESLSSRLRRGAKFTPRQAAALIRTIAEAVDYAHSLGVLHLDLKPANVLLDEAGTPYVADFGLARRLENALSVENDEVSGTPAYMAPEQAQVRAYKLTAATDIWGLGAVLYELLTGQPPFRADTAEGTVKLVLEGQVRAPRRLLPALPEDLQAITLRCLNRDPGERYPSARALADDLVRYVEGRPVQARPLNTAQRVVRWARREPRLAATVLLALGTLVVGLATTTTQWHRANVNARSAQANADTAIGRLWDSRDEAATGHMEAADGWKAVPLLLANLSEMEAHGQHARAESTRKRLGIIENANPRLTDVLPAPEGTSVLAFSPDARTLAATPTDLDLRLFDLASGKQLWRRGPDGNPSRPSWIAIGHMAFTADGSAILVAQNGSIWVPFPMGMFNYRVDAHGGGWLAPPQITDTAPLMRLGYSPDGVHAVTFQSDHGVQFWRADPWRLIASGAKYPGIEYTCAVLFAPDLRHYACRGLGPEKTWVVSTSSLRPVREIDPDDFGAQVAWAFSPDSRWLALGDLDGAVVVADVHTRELRRLSPRPLTRIHELAFSKDGAWLAAATGKGGIYLWKWPEGRLLTSPFGGDLQPSRVRLDREHLRVLASGIQGSASIWRIPEAEFAMDRGEAVPVGDRIPTLAITQGGEMQVGDAIAWHPGNDLVAHVATRGVQVQRLPLPILKRVHAAPIKPSVLRFDGRRLATVEGRRVCIIDAGTEESSGPCVELPQPPGFAELTADGKTLVVAAGRNLHAYDVPSGKLRFAPLALANSPRHLELNPDGGSVVTTFLAHDADGSAEVAEVWNLHDGRRIAGPVRLPGVQNDPLYNADGTRLLTWNFAYVSLRDGHTLAEVPGPLARLQVAPNRKLKEGYVCAATFDLDGSVWLSLVRGENPPELRHYDGDALHTTRTDGCLERMSSLPGNLQASISQDARAVVRGSDGVARRLPDLRPDTQHAELAASADGRWLARAGRDRVILFDVAANKRMAVLRVALPAPDIIWQLAFSPDGNRLLARSLRNRLMVWNLQPDTRSVQEITRELAWRGIATDADTERVQAEPTNAERTRLRANDPGAQRPAMVSASQPAVRTVPGGAIPPRDPATPPELLDLTDLYTFGFAEVSRGGIMAAGDYGWLAAGVQRLLGVDYDLRGGIQMQAETGLSDSPRGANPASFTLVMPRPDIAAVNTLVLANPSQNNLMRDVLEVTLHYADGGKVSYRTGKFNSLDLSEPRSDLAVAASGYDARAYPVRGRAERIYAVRFSNPEPGRAVRAVTFGAGEGSGVSAVILAVTVEPRPATTVPE